MTDENPDLPPRLKELLGSVPPAGDTVREAHISAALGAMGTVAAEPSRVIRMDFRRRALAVAAAVVLVGAAWVAGRASRGTGTRPTAADVNSATVATNYPKGFLPQSGSPVCTHGTIQMIDSVYIGDYVNPSDEHTYLVFTFNGRLEFVSKDTCTMVQLTTATTAP